MRIAEEVSRLDTLVWYDGPIIESILGDGKIFICCWVDCEYDEAKAVYFNLDIVVEVSQENYDAYKSGQLTLRDLEIQSNAIYLSSSDFRLVLGDKAVIGLVGERIPFSMLQRMDWLPSDQSYYDESLTHD